MHCKFPYMFVRITDRLGFVAPQTLHVLFGTTVLHSPDVVELLTLHVILHVRLRASSGSDQGLFHKTKYSNEREKIHMHQL